MRPGLNNAFMCTIPERCMMGLLDNLHFPEFESTYNTNEGESHTKVAFTQVFIPMDVSVV